MLDIHKTFFISDLHLEEKTPQSCKQFLHFLSNCDSKVDAIYILGDLFETWIGDDNDTAFNRQIIKAMRQTTNKGIPIYFLPGNRDFLIGKKFLHATGCLKMRDEHKISLYGTNILLMHGDTLCTDDIAYLRARKIIRNRFYLKLFQLLVPLKARQKFADRLRKKSKHYTKKASKEIMDVTQETVIHIMQKHDVAYLIHGHTHRPAIHTFTIQDSPVERIVLGAWHECGNALVWDSTGKKTLINF